MENYLTKEQVTAILRNAPQGSDGGKIVDALVARGYKLEGFNDQPEPQKPKGFNSVVMGQDNLQKATEQVGKMFPGQKVGEAIGTLAGLGVTKAKEALGIVPEGTTAQYDTNAPTPVQVAGDVAQGALTVAGFKAPVAGTVAGRVAQTAGLGAGLSASEAISEKKPVKEVMKDATKGAVVGAVAQGAFEGLPVVGEWLGKQAKNLRESNLKLTPPDKLKLNNKINEVVTFIKDKNITGNPEKQYVSISKYYNNAEDVIQSAVSETGKTYTRKELVDEISKIPEKYSGQFDNPEVYSQLEAKTNKLVDYIKKTFGDKYGDVIPAEKLNDLKRQYMKNGFNKAGDQISNEASLTIGDELYNKLLTDIPSLERLNSEYSTIITAKKILGKALGRNQLGAFGNLVSLGAGAGLGSIAGGPVGAVIGTVAGRPIATKIAGTAAKTQYAKGAEKVSEKLLKSKGSKIPRVITKLAD